MIDSGRWETGGFSTVLADKLAGLPEVELASPLRATPVGVSGTTTQLAGVDTATFERLSASRTRWRCRCTNARELGLLRAVGVTRRQVQTLVRWER